MGFRRHPRLSHRLAASVLLLSAAAAASDAPGRPVSLGEVTTRVVRRDVDLEALLRASMDAELLTLDVSRVPPNKWVILSASLVRMDAERGGRAVSCVVSTTVRGARGGAMVAFLEGRVRVEGERSSNASLERRAIRAAAHTTLARLPEALR